MYNGVGGQHGALRGGLARLLPRTSYRSLDGVGDDWPLDLRRTAAVLRAARPAFGVADSVATPRAAGRGSAVPPLPDRRWCAADGARARFVSAGTGAGAERGAVPAVSGAQRLRAYGTCMQAAQRCQGVRPRHALADRDRGARGCDRGAGLPDPGDGNGLAIARNTSTPKDAGTWCGGLVVTRGECRWTARILLNSASPRYPGGLANSSGLVGKRLNGAPVRERHRLFDEPSTPLARRGEDLSYQFYETDPARDFVRGAKWSLAPTGGRSTRAALTCGQLRWGEGHHAHVRAHLGHSLSPWCSFGEDLPTRQPRGDRRQPDRLVG